MARGFFSSGDSDSDDDYSDGDNHQYGSHYEEEELATDSNERLTRRLYKKHLKERYNLRKHETKIQQAVFRGDAAVEATARAEWKTYHEQLHNDPNSFLNYEHHNNGGDSGTADADTHQSTCVQLHQKPEYGHSYTAARSMEERETPRVRSIRLRLLKIREALVKGILAAAEEHPEKTPAASQDTAAAAATTGSPSADVAPSQTPRQLVLQSITRTELQELVVSWGYAKFRGDQIYTWIREKNITNPRDMDNLPKALRERLVVQFGSANSTNSAFSQAGGTLTAKEAQTLHARELKANMQAGTQTQDMFKDRLALLGYTRQKFHERAVLAMASLDKLDPLYTKEEEELPSSSEEDDENARLHRHIWNRLVRTQQVVSIGCGPGCDAVGALGFLTDGSLPSVPRLSNGVLLMDFAIDSWKDPVLDTLVPLVVPALAPVAEALPCNIRESLEDADDANVSGANGAAFRALTETHASHRRLVVISYLLTETRHAWKDFLGDLLTLLKGTQSLLLLTEPTAWQLQEFLRCFGGSSKKPATSTRGLNNHESDGDGDADANEDDDDDLLIKAHVWLDSSRDLPHLQGLDSRNGPAILLVCTM